ncbi:MAG: hypothetical protein FWG65_00505 [Turicibacter sp.]|nr:hypothetical protein [Turicibacter sp.]
MIKLPSIFSTGMVITKNAKIWGKSDPGTPIKVTFLGKTYTTETDSEGNFSVRVVSDDFGGPHKMKINEITIRKVYVGKVWLCGGQSNMEQPISRVKSLLEKHISPSPYIRAFQPESGLNFEAPAEDIAASWRVADKENLDSLFAVSYFFAKSILEQDRIPIGLINIAVGGTSAESWLPEEILQNDFPALHQKLQPYKETDFIKNIAEKDAERIQQWHEELNDKDLGLQEGWCSPKYDDKDWKAAFLWDNIGLPAYGSCWYRLNFYANAKTRSPVTLSLGTAVNSVKVFVNGKEAANIEYRYPPCYCVIPPKFFKRGNNVIAVRIIGETEQPKFVPGKNYSLVCKDLKEEYNLIIPWRRRVGAEMPALQPATWMFSAPCGVYNHMLSPVLGYSLDGVIWYQGESNTGDPAKYKELFTAFVKHLRDNTDENLPVIFTQLADFVDPSGVNPVNWAIIRDAQRRCLSIPHTAMAVTIDCGEYNDLHPQDKKTVGERLALHAKELVYKQKVPRHGPMVKAAIFKDGVLTVSFRYSKGLWAKNGRPELEIEYQDGTSASIYAQIVDNALVAKIADQPIKTVSFAKTDCPAVTLYNAYNLPASPFILDEIDLP